MPLGFTECVLNQLPDRVPERQFSLPAQIEAALQRARSGWESWVASLSHPASRRRLVPVLTVAASLLLVVALAFGLLGDRMPSTPGAATGTWSWTVGIVVLVALVLVALLVLWRRKR